MSKVNRNPSGTNSASCFSKRLKGKKITETFKKLEGPDKKQYENEVMIPEFNKVLKEDSEVEKERY